MFCDTVFDRLALIAKEKIEKSHQIQKNDENVDPKTGQPLFKP